MRQPKFVFENLKDWTVAKAQAKNAMEEEGISIFTKAARTDWFNKLDTLRPTHQDK